MLSYYTRNGFRVIAIAGKSVEGMTWLKAQRMRRYVTFTIAISQVQSDVQ
jgi:cation-transporting ATPase 13A3/4/5